MIAGLHADTQRAETGGGADAGVCGESTASASADRHRVERLTHHTNNRVIDVRGDEVNNDMHHLFPKRRIGASAVVIAILVLMIINSKSVSWGHVYQSLREIGGMSLALALCMAVAQYLCLALRFFALLPKVHVSPPRICRIYAVGQLLNHVVLARAGDLYKIFAVNKASSNRKVSTAYVVSALITERFLASLTLFLLVFLLVDWSAMKVTDLRVVDAAHQVVIGIIVVLLTAGVLYFVQKKSTRLRGWLRELVTSFTTIMTLPRLSVSVGLSFLVWTFEALSMQFLAAALQVDLGLGQGILVLLMLNIGIAVPLTLANVGVYEAALVFGLNLWGVELNKAIAVALCHHLLQIAALAVWVAAFNLPQFRGQYT